MAGPGRSTCRRFRLGGIVGLVILCIVALPPLLPTPWAASPALAQRDPFWDELNRANELNSARKYQQAIDLLNQLAEKVKARFGEHHDYYGWTLSELAASYRALIQFDTAALLLKRALAIFEKNYGVDHPDTVHHLGNLGYLHVEMGEYLEGERLLRRALAVRERVPSSDLPLILIQLAELYRKLDRLAEAEPLHRRALAIAEKTEGADSLAVALSLTGLASVYEQLGRFTDSETVYRRAAAIVEKIIGPDQPAYAESLSNLAVENTRLKRYAEAEKLLQRALVILEKAVGRDHPAYAGRLDLLGRMYLEQGRFNEAEAVLRPALVVYEKGFGADSSRTATILSTLASSLHSQGRHADAAPLFGRALAIKHKALGDHLETGEVAFDFAQLNRSRGRIVEALDLSRRSVRIAVGRLGNDAGGRLAPELSSMRKYFDLNIALLYQAMAAGQVGEQAIAEAFETAQAAGHSVAAMALNQMAARVGAGRGDLAELARDQQDTTSELHALDKTLLAEVAKLESDREGAREEAMRRRMKLLETRLAQLNARIATDFPHYTDLLKPRNLTIAEVQTLIRHDDAMLLFHLGSEGSFVWAVTRERVVWRKIERALGDIDLQILKLREALDPSKSGNVPAFDRVAAHSLYSALLEPVAEVLSAKRHLIVVASGSLTSLPLHVLVSEKPRGEGTAPSDYRQTAWLARTHAVTMLPAVSSLKILQAAAERAPAPRPYLGFGDPVFESAPGTPAQAPAKQARASAAPGLTYRGAFRGVRADVEGLSKALPALPDTADELRAVARALRVPDQIRLGADATERTVKSLRLEDYRIIHFATHALVAGETALFSEQAEPALALTLPQTPTDLDDGLLTSSEIAALRLNAQWVILSACNTAAGNKPGAEALSGLARAFFYAGASTLLVSHWPVVSDAAVRLTTRTIQALEQDNSLYPAEALRRAMIGLIDEAGARDAHPAIWAPFVIVGKADRSAR